MNCGDSCVIIDNNKQLCNENNNIIIKESDTNSREVDTLPAEVSSQALASDNNVNDDTDIPKVLPSESSLAINISSECSETNLKPKIPPSILKSSLNYKIQHTLLPPKDCANDISCSEQNNHEHTFDASKDRFERLDIPAASSIPRSLSFTALSDAKLNERLKKRRVSFPVDCRDSGEYSTPCNNSFLQDFPQQIITTEKVEAETQETKKITEGYIKPAICKYWIIKLLCSLPLGLGLTALTFGVNGNLVIFFCIGIAIAILLFYPLLSVIGVLYDFFSPIYLLSKYSPSDEEKVSQEKNQKPGKDHNKAHTSPTHLSFSCERRASSIPSTTCLPSITEEANEPVEEEEEKQEEGKVSCHL